MKRRDFLSSAGAGAAGFGITGKATAAIQPTDLQGSELTRVSRAIQAHFGGGFSVCSARSTDTGTTCLIENRGNYLRVASSDGHHWITQRATEM